MNNCQDGNTPRIDLLISTIPVKIPNASFTKVDKLILKFIWNGKGFRIAQTIMKKHEIVGLTLPDFKTYNKV